MLIRIIVASTGVLLVLAMGVKDAALLQQHAPREHIERLVAYYASPALLLLALALVLRRMRAFFPVAVAAVVPPIIRWLMGGPGPDAAFDRLTLNPLWFVLVWLPSALAVIVMLGSTLVVIARAGAVL